MTAGTTYFIGSPPWATTAAGFSRASTDRRRRARRGWKPFGSMAATGMGEGQIECDVGWAVEEAEQLVADPSWFVEPVDKNARRVRWAPRPSGEGMTWITSGLPSVPRCAVISDLPPLVEPSNRTVAATVMSSLPPARFHC